MSRLFDALREARRFRQLADGSAPSGLWADLGIQESDKGPASKGPAVVAAPAVAPRPPLAVSKEADAILDRRARLIPHALDRSVVEHYRRLRTKILQLQAESSFRTLVVTSAYPQEGKTLTTLNLALSLASLPSYRVLVVDGDLRRGTLGKMLGASENHPGLSNLLDGSAAMEDVLLRSSELSMHFMVRGSAQHADLYSAQFVPHFRQIADQFDLVLVDSPPVNLLADVQLLAGAADAVLLVARAFATSRKALEKAVQDLSRFRIIGAVLNAGTVTRSKRYYGYY